MSQPTLLDIINNTSGTYTGDLRYYFKIIFNAPNSTLPYHNFRHTCHVLYHSHQAIMYYGDLSTQNARNLLIAAMFHDYNHTGKSDIKDSENILLAIEGLRNHILEEDRNSLGDIIALIESTEYPHKEMDVTLSMEILRDADQSQTFDIVWIQQIIFGLSQEKGISPIELLKKQIPYIQSIEMLSDWGKETFYPKKENFINQVEKYLEILS